MYSFFLAFHNFTGTFIEGEYYENVDTCPVLLNVQQ